MTLPSHSTRNCGAHHPSLLPYPIHPFTYPIHPSYPAPPIHSPAPPIPPTLLHPSIHLPLYVQLVILAGPFEKLTGAKLSVVSYFTLYSKIINYGILHECSRRLSSKAEILKVQIRSVFPGPVKHIVYILTVLP